MTTCATVHFTGHVQGVGFRYTVTQIAKGYEVTGYVRNLIDGRVELRAEGDTREIDAFIAEIGDHMSGYVRKTERSDAPASGEFSGFAIR